jgi:hypothetical protein
MCLAVTLSSSVCISIHGLTACRALSEELERTKAELQDAHTSLTEVRAAPRHAVAAAAKEKENTAKSEDKTVVNHAQLDAKLSKQREELAEVLYLILSKMKLVACTKEEV